jgi:hypothetical protein
LEKSPWAVFLRGRSSSALPRPNPVGEASPCHLLPRDAAKRAPAPHGPHTSASLLRGQKPLRTRPATVPGTLPNPSPFLCSGFVLLTGAIPATLEPCPSAALLRARCCAVWSHRAPRRPLALLHVCAAVTPELSPHHQSSASVPGAEGSQTNQVHDKALTHLLGCR